MPLRKVTPRLAFRRPVLRCLALIAAVLLAGCGSRPSSEGGFVSGDGSISRIPPAQRIAAPQISGVLLDGKPWSSTGVKDKVLVYNVWGSWCPPCRKEAPALVAAAKRTQGRAEFVGLNTRDLDRAPAAAFVRAFGVTYPNLYDPEGRLLLQFGGELPASAIPTTLLVDSQGRIAARVIGEASEATLVGLVDELVAGQ